MNPAVIEILTTSLSSATLVAIVIWLSRTWIERRLTASIHLETEEKLAKLKAELDSANQKIRDLAAVATSVNQQVEFALLEHRIAAVKVAWESVHSWQKINAVSMFVSVLTDEWIKKYSSHQSTKKMVEQLLNGIEPIEFMKEQNKALIVRPFLSEPAWALFFTFHSFQLNRLSKALILTFTSVDHVEAFKGMNERQLVEKTAPPEILSAYDANPYSATELYLNHLREKLLHEFREMLSGHNAGQKALNNAAEVVRAAEVLSSHSAINLAKSNQVPNFV